MRGRPVVRAPQNRTLDLGNRDVLYVFSKLCIGAVIHRYAYMLWVSTTRINTLAIIVMATVRMQAALNDHILSFSPPHG